MKVSISLDEMELNGILLNKSKDFISLIENLQLFKVNTPLGDFDVALTSHRCGGNSWFPDHEFVFERVRLIKAEEVIAAEHAVEKAQQALAAAEQTLSKIKEKY